METRIVDEAKRRPGRCLASGDTVGPFIDTGRWTREHDPYVYISVRWLEWAAKKFLDMVPAETVEKRFAALEEQVKSQDEKLTALAGFEEATAEYVEARDKVLATVPPERGNDTTELVPKEAA